jgi:hypothetical protein
MQKKPLYSRKFTVKALSFLIVFYSLFILASCGNNDKKAEPVKGVMQTQTVSSQMNCVILTKAQVQTWVDSGWTNPVNPNKITKLLLQFYTADASLENSNMQLIAYPGQSITTVQINGKQTLGIDTTCVPKTLTGSVIFGNNEVSLASLKILKSDGTLTDFDYIRFVPQQSYPPYVNFKVEIVKLGAEMQDGGGTWPCPPYCG